MELNLKGKVALITGGSRGLGFNAAEGLLKAGAKRVYITARKVKEVEAAAKTLSNINPGKGDCVGIISDITDLEQLKKVVKQVSETEDGKLDILIANAGASWGAPFLDHPDEAVDKVLTLNVRRVFTTIQLFTPLLAKAAKNHPDDPSRVITVASVAGLTTSKHNVAIPYAASKAAVIHLSKILAMELSDYNINVNCIAPGFFPSKMANGLIESLGTEYLSESNPRKRIGRSEDLEAIIVFLSAAQSNYLNGTVINLDGGAYLNTKSVL